MIRPYVANIDCLLIFIAPLPEPDFMLLDKLIINCNMSDIEPIICYNKSDISMEYYNILYTDYAKHYELFDISALNYDIPSSLLDYLKGKLVALAGQSATGKSTFINNVMGLDIKTGDVSKILRGKHTTRHIEIYKKNDIMLADTCGFSAFKLELDYRKLHIYYDDYMEYQHLCKFNSCTHTNEPECAVKINVEKGILSLEKYNRYIQIFYELKESYDNI